MSKRQNWAVIASFLLFLFGFAAASLFKPDTAVSESENRDLAQMPDLNLQDVLSGAFSSAYETYLSDQFVFRDRWIGVKTSAERAMGKQEVNDVYFAADGYLIEKHSGEFDTEQANRNIDSLAAFIKAQSRRMGGEHVKALIAPNALAVLEDKLPPFADGNREKQYLQKLKAALPEGSYVDVYEALAEHKDEYIYYRTDHHWTTLGAWYAYRLWAGETALQPASESAYRREVLSTDFHGTVQAKVNIAVPGDTLEAWLPREETACQVIFNRDAAAARESLYDESYLDTRDKYAVFFGGNQPLTEIKTQADNGRRLLVIKDSYANCFVPFAVGDFQEIAMVDMRYFNERLSEYMEEKGFTDLLFLYNASGFAGDVSLAKLAL